MNDEVHVPAGPASRRLARELGVDIATVATAHAGARVSVNDVKAYAKSLLRTDMHSSGDTREASILTMSVSSQHYESGAKQEVNNRESWSEPLTGIGLATSVNMSRAWKEIPHAWLQEKVDITDLEEWRQSLKTQNNIHLTITALIVKAMAVGIKSFPKMNSSLDEENNVIIYKNYIDIGVAVDTEHGLMVPALRGVDSKNLVELSQDLKNLSDRSRQRKLLPQDFQGAGITLSNLGGIGLSSIFPIVNWPQAAIVGVAASDQIPRLIDGEWVERRMLTLTLGFDHRIINGADGARFLVCLKNLLEDIRRLNM